MKKIYATAEKLREVAKKIPEGIGYDPKIVDIQRVSDEFGTRDFYYEENGSCHVVPRSDFRDMQRLLKLYSQDSSELNISPQT